MLRIVTDGGADMPERWADEYDIHVLPMCVRFGEQVFFPGIDLSKTAFYQKVIEKRQLPKSSVPSPLEVKQFLCKIAEKGDSILSINLASRLSGTLNVFRLAAEELREEFNITIFDSCAGSAALGFMCREARLMNRRGLSLQTIIERLEAIRKQLTVIFTVNTLEFAYLSGRVNLLQSAVSSLLNIKPIITLRDGLLQMSEKVRTRQKSLDRVVECVKERVGSKKVNVAVVHAADPEIAARMVDMVRKFLNIQELVVSELSIPVAANLGPGTVGIVAYPED